MARSCENCLFGVLAPDRYTKGKPKKTPTPPVWHCSINPPVYPSGHPVVEGSGVCSLYTTREDEPKQPLRSLAFVGGIASPVSVKG